MHGFEENGQKPNFWAKITNFWTKKGSKTGQKKNQNFKFIYPLINQKYCSKNKT